MWQTFKNYYHFLTAWAFQLRYGFPCRKLKVIGITGTDGKTTTSSLIHHVLTSAGKKASLITSVAAVIGGKAYDTGFHVTTPDPQDIPRYMAEAVNRGDEYFVFEITSHGLEQHRAAGVRFIRSGITNITHEHLGYHKTFENYVAAKAKIARLSQCTLVNADQPDIVEKVRKLSPHAHIKTFGLSNAADYDRDVTTELQRYVEPFNKYNILLAYGICHELGVADDVFLKAVASFQYPPGRMEEIHRGPFIVVSDFAHTPNAIAHALAAVLEKYKTSTRLIHVFGAAAFRDDSKRPEMGRASATHASITILTEEDYRTEDPERIFAMLAQGLEECGMYEVHAQAAVDSIPNKSYMKILNREEALRKAIDIAKSEDVIIVTGKAQEKSLCRGTTEYPYDEKVLLQGLIAEKGKSTAQ